MKEKFNIFHPYFLAVVIAVISFGTLIYVGLIAPTPEEQESEVQGVTTQTELYTKEQIADYGSDLLIKDQSGEFNGATLDQQEIDFTAYSEATVTYDLYKITNNTNERISLRISPSRVNNSNMNDLTVKLKINGGTFELYTQSEIPNRDYFAISIDPYDSEKIKLVVTADKLLDETAQGEILFQIVEM